MAGTRIPERGLRWGLLASGLLLASIAAASTPREHVEPRAADALARFDLSLGTERPYRFRLHYRGSTMPFRGPVCYAFAGYNETCRDPDIDWLTPASVIDLWAPGGVPRELLEGYVMLVRFPALSERRYRYALEGGPERRQTRRRQNRCRQSR
jgi:hypothetical protein